jgi:hypothetical protein
VRVDIAARIQLRFQIRRVESMEREHQIAALDE